MNIFTHKTLDTYKVVPYFNTITLTNKSFPAMFDAFNPCNAESLLSRMVFVASKIRIAIGRRNRSSSSSESIDIDRETLRG